MDILFKDEYRNMHIIKVINCVEGFILHLNRMI